MIWRNASPTSRSEPVTPGRSAFVESPSMRSTPRLPSSASLPDVRAQAVDRRVVELVVARVQHAQAAGLEHDARRCRAPSAPCARTRAGTGRSRPGRPRASISSSSVGVQSPCSSSFDWRRPSVSFVPPDLRHRHLAQQVRQRADVILVRVREQHGADAPACPSGTRSPAGRGRRRDARRAGTRGRRRRRRAPRRLVDGHVLPDLAEAAERDDPQYRHGLKYHLRAAKRVSMIHPSEGGSGRGWSSS